MDRLAIVIPCYNEQEVFPECARRLSEYLELLINNNSVSADSFLLFVDDGSRDATWSLIEQEHKKNRFVMGLKLAGNVGHQNALLAGLLTAAERCDVTISIDADLQDDINAIGEMINKYNNEGCDIVYGVRSNRDSDTFFKRTTAQGFYRFMSLMGAKSVYNHADFRLMSRRAVQQLAKYKERNLYLRGIVPLIGFKSGTVSYERKERFAGKSKYPLKKMLQFAFNGITSFSSKPLSLITLLGILIIFLCLVAFIYTIISYCIGSTTPGWSSLMLSIWFLGGVQLVSVGLVGQYVGKIFEETKSRPRYNVETLLMDEHEE